MAGEMNMTTSLTMRKRVELYLNHRHCLGYDSPRGEKDLLRFADSVDKKGYFGPLTVNLATEWIATSVNNTRATQVRKLGLIHGFAKYCQIIDPQTKVPPLNLYGSARRQSHPHIYSKKEIHDLLEATKKLTPTDGLRPITFKYLLGLLASTGLRISEAIRLTLQDVDLENEILTVRETKFHKSRYVPLHPTTCEALKEYVLLRNRHTSGLLSPEFFITNNCRPLELISTEKTFKTLREYLGWIHKPRLYDFRHTFACQRLLKWYQEGKDVDKMMIYLSTYLGHVRVTDTYWYITAIPELLLIVSKRFENFANLPEEVANDGR